MRIKPPGSHALSGIKLANQLRQWKSKLNHQVQFIAYIGYFYWHKNNSASDLHNTYTCTSSTLNQRIIRVTARRHISSFEKYHFRFYCKMVAGKL